MVRQEAWSLFPLPEPEGKEEEGRRREGKRRTEGGAFIKGTEITVQSLVFNRVTNN